MERSGTAAGVIPGGHIVLGQLCARRSVGQLAPSRPHPSMCLRPARVDEASLRRRTLDADGGPCEGSRRPTRLLHMDQTRIDKWLWAARFFKARSLATEAVLAGHVRLNGVRAKPAKEVRVGDTVEARVGFDVRTVVVRGIADRRGSAAAAALLYDETEESLELRRRNALQRRLAQPLGADLGARPTKQDRRRLDALRRRRR
jgi:ribosome-associated heat shock protein Hsp15